MDYGLLKKYTRDLKVLFVEDDNDFRAEFSELLSDIFMTTIDTAANGQEGLERYEAYYKDNNKYYDLIITDIKMPKVDGVEMVGNIYKINNRQKVIVLSARNEFEYLMNLLNLGIEHFFPKPIEFNKFLKDVLNICEKIYHTKQDEGEKDSLDITDSITWSIKRKELYINGEIINLTKMEIILLDKLTEQNARLFTMEELFTVLWGSPYSDKATIDNLKNVISRLRKIAPALTIDNLYGMGYKLQIK